MTVARRAVAAVLVALVLAVAACGEERESGPADPGETVTVGGISYDVELSRQLNPRIQPDKTLYIGAEPPPGQALVGVFLRACNRSDQPGRSAALELRDEITDRTFAAERGNVDPAHAYEPARLEPGQCLPRAASPARDEGALAVFKVPVGVFRDRQLVLLIDEGKSIDIGL